jgi:hypothetical protein
MGDKLVKSVMGLAILGLAGYAVWRLAEDGTFNSIIPKAFAEPSSSNQGGLFGGTVIPSNAYHVNVAT